MVTEWVRYMRDFLIPDSCQNFIVGPELINPHHFSPGFATGRVVDQHPVAPEFPAYGWPGRIDSAGKASSIRVFPHENTAFMGRTWFFGVRFCEFFLNLICKLGLYMDWKDLISDAKAAIIIPLRELPLDFYELAKTCTAFPAPVAIKLRHKC